MNGEFAVVDGLRLFFLAAGAGAPILFVHGNTGSGAWFSRAMDLPGFRAYAVDMPNFGRSDAMPGEPDLHSYADWLLKFMDSAGLENPILVGHSLGGGVAQSLATRHPERVRGLVLVDSAAPTGLVTPRERYPFIDMMRNDRSILSKALRATVPTLNDEAFFDSLVDDAVLMAGPAWVGNAEALSRFDIAARCLSYAKPVLVIWGRKDFIITEEMAKATANAYPKGSLRIVESCGHSVIVEDPELFKSLLTEFAAGM